MPRQPYASPVMNIRIIFICHHPFFVDFITVGANRIRPINVFVANRLCPVFIFGKYFCVEFDCAEFDLGEFIWCEFGLVRIGYLGECDSPLREYNSSDCHFVGLFSLILPSLIIWVEFDCD